MMQDIYSISGWYEYTGDQIRIPQSGCFAYDPLSGKITRGFIYDARWGIADIEGIMGETLMQFSKHYGDGSDNVLYTLRSNDHWTGMWKAEKHDGTAELWIARLANAEDFSFDKAGLHEKTKYMRKRRHE